VHQQQFCPGEMGKCPRVREDGRVGGGPPAKLPQPSPAMNAATTTVAECTSAPEKKTRRRCQMT